MDWSIGRLVEMKWGDGVGGLLGWWSECIISSWLDYNIWLAGCLVDVEWLMDQGSWVDMGTGRYV